MTGASTKPCLWTQRRKNPAGELGRTPGGSIWGGSCRMRSSLRWKSKAMRLWGRMVSGDEIVWSGGVALGIMRNYSLSEAISLQSSCCLTIMDWTGFLSQQMKSRADVVTFWNRWFLFCQVEPFLGVFVLSKLPDLRAGRINAILPEHSTLFLSCQQKEINHLC